MNNSIWKDQKYMGTEAHQYKRWLDDWDASHYLKKSNIPLLWVAGSNDVHFPMDSLQLSYRSTQNKHHLCIRIEMPHSQTDGAKPQEIFDFADSILKHKTPLADLGATKMEAGKFKCDVKSECSLINARLVYTCDDEQWSDRKYNAIDVEIGNRHLEADIPENTTVAFFNVEDERHALVSSEHIEL
jgi:hypothetical protein